MSNRIIIDWRGLKELGWPYSRTQTWRLMQPTVTAYRKVKGLKERVAEEIPNPDPFPACFKLRADRNSHPVWRLQDVLAYFEAHGLRVTEDATP